MSGDYTRSTFRHDKHFSGVRQQQGRVLLDADWNEAVDIGHHGQRTALIDVIGRTGMPEDAAGFELTPVSAGGANDLIVGTGRAYVDGLLVDHLEADPTTIEKESGSGASTVWIVTGGPRLAAGQWVRLQAESLPNAVTISELVESPVDGDDRQRVKLVVDLGGTSQTIVGLASYGTQSHEPTAPPDLPGGPYFVYLDVWEREITGLDDEALREAALGGVDTTLRTRVTWKVELLALQPLIDDGTIASPPTCEAFEDGWSPLGTGERVKLAARTNPVAQTPDPCALPSQGGYRSLDNRLYRVEVHARVDEGGTGTTFVKWSRDNGIHRSRLLEVKDGSLVVDSIGLDTMTAFKPSEWVEVIDEPRVLKGEPGFVVEIAEVLGMRLGITTILDPLTLQPLTQGGAPDTDVLPAAGFVRRWEGGQPVEAVSGTWLTLENGIEVQLTSGLTQTGDYWLIPARTTTASIEWPVDEATGNAQFEPPHGITHHICALAMAERAADGTWTITDDCRDLFPPLTELESFFYLGGDGQELCVGQPAPSPLTVGVFRGGQPVQGVSVTFQLTQGDATVAPAAVTTDASGIAAATLVAGASPLAAGGVVKVVATPGGTAFPAPPAVTFTARFVNANCVYLNRDICPDGQSATGSNTVAALIQHLCETRGNGKSIHVTGVFWLNAQGSPVAAKYDDVIDPEVLARGVVFEFDNAVDAAAVAPLPLPNVGAPVGEVELDLMFPEERLQTEWWQRDTLPAVTLFATRTTRLDGSFALGADQTGRQQRALRWSPSRTAQDWLRTGLPRVMQRRGVAFVEARALLRGNRIWSANDRLFLDGDLFRDPANTGDPVYPTGDGRRGGDLSLPFFVVVRSPGVIRGSLTLVAIVTSPFFNTLSRDSLTKLAGAVDASIDRPALESRRLVPDEIAFDTTRTPTPSRARTLLQEAALGNRQLRVLVPGLYKDVFEAMRQDMSSIGLNLRVVAMPASATIADVVARVKRRNPGVDAVLADDEMLNAFAADPAAAAKIGASILTL